MLRTVVVCTLFGLLLLCTTGCYTTRVSKPGTPAVAYEYQKRQWFLVGFVPLSDRAGDECPGGFKAVTSRLAVPDVLLGVGLAVAGSVAGQLACGLQCAGFGNVLSFVFSSRTVRYTCNAARTTQIELATSEEEVFRRLALPAPELGRQQRGDRKDFESPE